MIKVTLGEVKTQDPKPFPKLMKSNTGKIIEVLETPNENGRARVIIRIPYFYYSGNFQVINGHETFQDYNEPITIQNA